MRMRAVAIALLWMGAMSAIAIADTPAIEPQADDALKRMSACITQGKAFACEVHAITEQIIDGGQLVDLARNQKVLVRRPDRATATVTGDQETFQFFYDGAHVTLFNPTGNAYATVDAPATLGKTMDMLATKYGIAAPLADLVFDDPYKVLTENVTSMRYIGQGYVLDKLCHHIACTQTAVDWQMWIDTRDKPLPRKMAITYKLLPGQPRYTAYFIKWDLSPKVSETAFVFKSPDGAKAVPMFSPTTQPVSRTPTGALGN